MHDKLTVKKKKLTGDRNRNQHIERVITAKPASYQMIKINTYFGNLNLNKRLIEIVIFVAYTFQVRLILKILFTYLLFIHVAYAQVIDVTELYPSGKYFFPNFEHLGENEGLPHFRISSLIEDHEGYVWIGTKDGGLVRYDGLSFKSFRFNPADPFSIPSNDVSFIFEDSRDILWVATEKALCFFHPFNQQFIQVHLFGSSGTFAPIDYSCMIEDRKGNLLIGSSNGIFTISGIDKDVFLGHTKPFIYPDSAGAQISLFTLNNNDTLITSKAIRDIKIDQNDKLWILTKYDLLALDYNETAKNVDPEEKTIELNSYIQRVANIIAYHIEIDNSGTLWVSAADNLLKVNTNTKPLKAEISYLDRKTSKIEDFNYKSLSGNIYWFGVINSDLQLYHNGNDTFYPITFKSNDINNLHEQGISCFLRTRSNVIFIGTPWGGIYKFNPNAFKSYCHPNLQEIHLSQTANLRNIYEDSEGDVWMITKDISRCNINTGEIISTFAPELFEDARSHKNKILEDGNGRFWIGTEGTGLYYLDTDLSPTKKARAHKVFDDKTITALHTNKDGIVWASTHFRVIDKENIIAELYKIENTGEILGKYIIKEWERRSDEHEDQFINHIYPDEDGNIWLAAGFGLARFNPETEKLITFSKHQDDNIILQNHRILSICPDPIVPEKYLWLGTAASGLLCFDIYTQFCDLATTTSGLPGNHIGSVMADDFNNLWLGTDRGIAKVELARQGGEIKKIRWFDKSDGLITNDFTNYYGHNAFRSKNGELIFVGPKGFQIIDPAFIKTDLQISLPKITGININYKAADFGEPNSPLVKPISTTKFLCLPHDQNTLGFEIKSIDFKAPGHLQYGFMLEGYDKDWVNNGNSRNFQYTKLPHGNYKLKLRVANRDSGWMENPVQLKIKISRPWWLTFWAYGLYVLFFGVGVWGVHKFQMGRQKLKMDIEINKVEANKFKELDSLKSMFFANISHEFRTPLTLILGPIENMLKNVKESTQRNSLVMMQRNARQLQKYINEILDLSKLEANKLKLKTRELDIVKYTSFMLSSFESRAGQKGITLNMTSTSEELICYLDPDKINSILSNLISNAIKYSTKGSNVSISVSSCLCDDHSVCTQLNYVKNGGCAVISVKDTGIGIPKDKLPFIFDRYYRVEKEQTGQELGTGLGLTLVRELVHLHRGTISVTSEDEKFTEFVCKFPMGKNHLKADEIVEGSPYELEDGFHIGLSPGQEKDSTDKSNGVSDPDKKIILLVEDSDDMRTLIQLGLKDKYNVIEAKDGEEGEKVAIETCPDLIICDVSMPKKKGFEVVKSLKKNEITSHVPIILLTGRATMSDKLDGLETGADEYLIKPFNTKELKIRINNLLEQREKLKAKYSSTNILDINKLPEKSIDQEFLQKVIHLIEENLTDEAFDVQVMITKLAVSRTQLHRKLKALTNQSANELIQNIRLTKASQMLKNNSTTVGEISYLVGFTSPAYFSRLFKKHFGHSPTEH